jgi:hypothetical protein
MAKKLRNVTNTNFISTKNFTKRNAKQGTERQHTYRYHKANPLVSFFFGEVAFFGGKKPIQQQLLLRIVQSSLMQ